MFIDYRKEVNDTVDIKDHYIMKPPFLNMKKFDTTDFLFLILFLSWVSDLNFQRVTLLQWIGLGAVIFWVVLTGIKIIKR